MFSQLLDFLDRNHFNYLVRKYDGDKYVKNFTCYNQLVVLMYGQLSNRESLRDVVLATQAFAGKAYHLGFGKYTSRSTLADANNKRDYRIFEEFAYQVVAKARECRATDIFKLGGNVYAFDSTTIELCLDTFKWLKQHLKIKKFWSESENAVRIQIYTAITAYCMMAIVQKKMRIDRPIYEMLQLVSASLAEATPLDVLFGKPNYNIVNELNGSTEPTLF